MEESNVLGGMHDFYKNLFSLAPLHQILMQFVVRTFLFNTLPKSKAETIFFITECKLVYSFGPYICTYIHAHMCTVFLKCLLEYDRILSCYGIKKPFDIT
jgi:hypothetical protein